MNDLDPQLNHIPANVKNIHIMGICGTGMAAMAGMLQKSGYSVQGSDSHVYPPMSDFLDNLGIRIFDGYHPENLDYQPDLVIVGNVITKINPEAQRLAETDIPYISFPQALAHYYISSRQSLVVAGTHGKTTTCSLLATALFRAELDPTFMIGGILPEFGGNFRIGEGDYFVAEGDEYDTAFFDKVSKFLYYQPKISILTSIEFDHADIFDTLDDIKDSFKKYVALIPEDGLLIANFDDANVREVAEHAVCTIQSYGLSQENDWTLSAINHDQGMTTFTAHYKNEKFGDFRIQLPGRHNCLNSLAVIALLKHIGLPAVKIQKGLETFGGVRRRQEIRGIEDGITVIDDFAHHPTAVRETIDALRNAYSKQRLVVVFEPRTNTSRRAFFQQEYARSFNGADLVCLREPVPLTNIDPGDHFSSSKLAEDLRNEHNLCASAFKDTDDILHYLEATLEPGDVVAVLSNGGFDNIHTRLLEALKDRGKTG